MKFENSIDRLKKNRLNTAKEKSNEQEDRSDDYTESSMKKLWEGKDKQLWGIERMKRPNIVWTRRIEMREMQYLKR